MRHIFSGSLSNQSLKDKTQALLNANLHIFYLIIVNSLKNHLWHLVFLLI